MIWPGFSRSHRQRSSNKVKWFSTIIQFHHFVAHMLTEVPQTLTQLVSGEGGAEFGELMEDLLMFQGLLTNTSMKPPEGPIPPLPNLPPRLTSASRHDPPTPTKWWTSKGPECFCVPVPHTNWEETHYTGAMSKSLFVTPATSCMSKCPLLPPATLSAHGTLSGVQAYSPKSWADNAVFPIPSRLSLSFLPIYENPCLIFL